MSVESSLPTTRGLDVGPVARSDDEYRAAPSTTWALVRMWPSLSITKPEPSDCSFSVEGGVKNDPATCLVVVAVMTVTPGASCL